MAAQACSRIINRVQRASGNRHYGGGQSHPVLNVDLYIPGTIGQENGQEEIALDDVHENADVYGIVKRADIMNIAQKSNHALEKALAAKLRELLTGVPWLKEVQIWQNPSPFGREVDMKAQVTLPSGNIAELWVACHDLLRLSRFPYVTLNNDFPATGKRATRVPVLAAPLITNQMAELCEKHNWSWFDLAGNCWLNVPDGIFIERRGNDPMHEPPEPWDRFWRGLGTASWWLAVGGRI